MRTLLFLFTLLSCETSSAQMSDSLRIATASDWRPQDEFFADSILVFNAIDRLPPLDTAGLNKIAKDSIFFAWHAEVGDRIYGERLSFDAAGRSSFTNYLPCKVGATVYRMRPFYFDTRKMCVQLNIAPWNQLPWEEERCYEIVALSATEMVWRRMQK